MSMINLFSEAIAERIEEPDARFSSESMPGIDGQFVQLFGRGARKIIVEGLLTAFGSSAADASKELKVVIRQRQDMVSGWTLGDYVGADLVTYSGCLLKGFHPTEAIQIETLATDSFRAYVSARAEIIQFAP